MVWIALFLCLCSIVSMWMAKRVFRRDLVYKERVWWALNSLTGLSAAIIAYANDSDGWMLPYSLESGILFASFAIGGGVGAVGTLILALGLLMKIGEAMTSSSRD